MHHISREIADLLIGNGLAPKYHEQDMVARMDIYWKKYALHIWSVDDVLGTAREKGSPMNKLVALEILAKMHSSIDSEHGLTWETVGWCVDKFKRSMDWEDLSNKEMSGYEGFFLLSWKTPAYKLQRYKVLLEKVPGKQKANKHLFYNEPVAMSTAHEEMVKISQKYDVPVDLYCVSEIGIDDPNVLNRFDVCYGDPLIEGYHFSDDEGVA